MIIILLVIVTLIGYFGGVYVRNRRIGNWTRGICDGLIVIILVAIIGNSTYHWGMKKVTQVQTVPLESSLSATHLSALLYRDLGTAHQERVYLYRVPGSTKPQATKTTTATWKVHTTSGSTAQLETRRQEWVYSNGWSRFLFGIANNDHELIQRHYNFKIPQTWLVLSTQQAQKLQRKLQNPAIRSQVTSQIQKQVQQSLAEAVKQQPQLTAQQRQQLIRYNQQRFQKQAYQALIK